MAADRRSGPARRRAGLLAAGGRTGRHLGPSGRLAGVGAPRPVRSRRMKWFPAHPSVLRLGVLALTGALLIGAALWAGAVGSWTARPRTIGSRGALPTITDIPAPPTLPTLARPPGSSSGSSWDLGFLLSLLAGALFAGLLVIVAAVIRRSRTAPPP